MMAIQHIYRGNSMTVERKVHSWQSEAPPTSIETVASRVPVAQIMKTDLICARRDVTTHELAELMLRHHIGSIPILEDLGRPIGVVTKLDLVEALCPSCSSDVPPGIRPRTANEVMMPLALTLGERASVAHAAAMMASEDVHHVMIVDSTGRLIGVVSSMDIVRWLARNDGYGAARASEPVESEL
jgi:CBS domain-containing protein